MALDLCVSAAPQGVYTLMGPELGEDGWVLDPIRLDWATGACAAQTAVMLLLSWGRGALGVGRLLPALWCFGVDSLWGWEGWCVAGCGRTKESKGGRTHPLFSLTFLIPRTQPQRRRTDGGDRRQLRDPARLVALPPQ